MKLWMLGAASAALILAVGAAGARQLPLPPLIVHGTPASLPRDFPLSERHARPPHETFVPEQIEAQAKAGATLPLWSASVADGVSGKNFTYMMVGQNPQTPLSDPATSVNVVIVPIVFMFRPSGTVFDPTTVDAACSPEGSAVDLTLASPLFSDIQLSTANGTDLGTGQYSSLFQRGNFFQFTGPDGINPGFALTLHPRLHQALAVPVTGGAVKSAPCGKLGTMDLATWDRYVQGTIFRMLRSALTPNKFPLFLLYNVVFFEGAPFACCTLGYHSGFSNPNHGSNLQTYGVAAYLSSREFKATDVSTLSHEINEWQDDPTAANPTPPWGHIGQVTGCQRSLEVGDPLSGTNSAITMDNGFTYHLQDLAFFSWFYHQTPSLGVDGLYSLFGNLSTPAPPCP